MNYLDVWAEIQRNGLKRYSLHEVGLLQTSTQMSMASLPLEMGARFRFMGEPAASYHRLGLLLTKAGDVESNPGPTTLVIWICHFCHKHNN